jgi:hypothetical protein
MSAIGVGIVSASLQQAVDESVDGCIIIMRAGTWNENVEIDNDLTIIGGYGGGETVISGGGFVGYGTGEDYGIDDSSVFTINYADVVLTGLTITHGGIGPFSEYGSVSTGGSGISNIGGTLTLNDVTITGNMAFHGGGIYNDHGTVILNSGTSIEGNSAGVYSAIGEYGNDIHASGGGIYNNGGTIIMNGGSSIAYNTAGVICIPLGGTIGYVSSSQGGGIYNDHGTVTLNPGSSITNNEAGLGGGIYNNGGTLNQYGGIVSGNIPDQIYNA